MLAVLEEPRWPIFFPKFIFSECTDRSIQRILSKVQTPDYIIACENPLSIIFASKIYPQGVDSERHDWFAELGLVKKRA
jgi:hypothetical protein